MISPALRARTSWMPKYPPHTNSVLWMPGQDDPQSATIRDRSGSGNDGVINGATWTQTSKGLWYLDYDAIDDITTIAASASFENIFDGGGTAIAWINPGSDGETSAGVIFNIGALFNPWAISAADEAGGFIKIRLFYRWDGTSYDTKSTTANIPINIWSHIAFTYDADSAGDAAILYFNGTSSALTTSTSIGTRLSGSGEILYIGNVDAGDRTFDGGLALPQLVSSILAATKIAGIYNAQRHLFGV